MATILEGLNAISQAVGGAGGAESNLEALNAISAALGGSSDAENNADAIANIAENASGGGGSSDFSTATVTVVVDSNPSEYDWYCEVMFSINTGELPPINETYFTSSGAVNVVLYQGEADVILGCDDGTLTVASYSGDITVGDTIVLTGDAEIHISIA